MRTITLSLATALIFSPVASARASAGDHHNHGGGGHHGHGGSGGGGGQVERSITGAGQVGSFSFGGTVKLKGNNKTRGEFLLIFHPTAPASSTLSVACKYQKFSQVTISPTTASFRAQGRCRRLLTSGEIETVDATNIFQFTNGAGSPDVIDVNFVGSGLAIASSPLDFGDFTFTAPVTP